MFTFHSVNIFLVPLKSKNAVSNGAIHIYLVLIYIYIYMKINFLLNFDIVQSPLLLEFPYQECRAGYFSWN